MAWDDKIWHDVKGVTGLRCTDIDDEGWIFEAETGVGKISIYGKPVIAFLRGVVVLADRIKGRSMCDDPELVAAYCAAFEGYNPYGDEWTHTAPGDREFDIGDGPHPEFKQRTREEALKYLYDHKIFHPGTPV